jgi:hypothetical protein
MRPLSDSIFAFWVGFPLDEMKSDVAVSGPPKHAVAAKLRAVVRAERLWEAAFKGDAL